MEERGATMQDVVYVLQEGEMVDGPVWNSDRGEWKCILQGYDLDDDELHVVTAVIVESSKIFLITVY